MPGNVTIFRTTNPVDFTQLDGVYIDERRPPGPIRGIGNDVACIVGVFERGPIDQIVEIGSTQQLVDTFGGYGPGTVTGTTNGYPGYVALVNKQFGRLRVIRVSNANMVTATKSFNDTTTPTPIAVLKVDANSKGAWGNSLSVAIEAASDGVSSHFNLRVLRSGVEVELHRNLDLAAAAVNATLPITSTYIVATKLAAGNGRPANAAAAALLTGSDGTFTAADYTGSSSDVRGFQLLYGQDASNIRWIFTDGLGDLLSVNASLVACATATKTKIAVIGMQAGQGLIYSTYLLALKASVSAVRSDRVVFAAPSVYTWVPEANSGKGALVCVSAAPFAAAALSALPPGRDPAGINSEPYLTGVRGLEYPNLSRNDYITLLENGVMAPQFAAERQRYGFRSGVTTSLDPALITISRRTIADYLQESIAAALVFYQNLPLNQENKLQIKGAIEDFLDQQINFGMLPSAADVNASKRDSDPTLAPYVVDIVSGNTPQQEAQGIFVVWLRVRIFPAMRFIVLRTEIGESVEIVEAND